jgi:hemerythrin
MCRREGIAEGLYYAWSKEFLEAGKRRLAGDTARAATSGESIPEPLQTEHHEVFEALEAATRSGGSTGQAATKVMAVLKPHFEKEEKFALPQLGALETLSKPGASISAETARDLSARSEKFRTELAAMLEEHKQIGTALGEMEKAAHSEKKDAIAELAKKIIGHAGMEEKVLYPTSLLIGEYAKLSERGR